MTNQMSTEVRIFNNVSINQRADGYIDATAMCKACNKRFYDWDRLGNTIEFLEALSESINTPVRNPVTEQNQGLIEIFQGGNPQEQGTWVHPDVAISLAQWLSPKFAVQVSKWVRELMTTGKVELQQPDISTHINAVKAYLGELEHSEVLKLERDKAITTKAHIGDKRQATAMNTASQAVKKANKLEVELNQSKIELDQSKQYCTIKRMEMIHHGQKFNWRLMKKTWTELGLEPIDIYDANYGTVKSYHKDVWMKAYALNIE